MGYHTSNYKIFAGFSPALIKVRIDNPLSAINPYIAANNIHTSTYIINFWYYK